MIRNLKCFQCLVMFFKCIYVLMLGIITFSMAAGAEKYPQTPQKKVVYLNIDDQEAGLNNDPFFDGLVIKENIEKPEINFDFPFVPIDIQVEMEPGIRKMITTLKRENTFDYKEIESEK